MTAVLYVPETQPLTITKKVTNTTFSLTEYGTTGNYTLYEGSVTVSNAASVIVKVSLGEAASKTVQSKIFVGGF